MLVCSLPHARIGGDPEGLALGTQQDSVGRRLAELTAMVDQRQANIRDKIHSTPDVLVVLDGARRLRTLPAVVDLLRRGPAVGVMVLCVEDEVAGGLFYLPTVLWNVVPRLVDDLERAVEAHYGRRPHLRPPLVFRSWIGGDRDGNPNVIPATTRWAQDFARETAVRGFVGEIDGLIRDLSISTERLPVPGLSRKNPSAVRSPVMNSRSRSSTSEVMSRALSASVRAMTSVGVPHTSAARRAAVRLRSCAAVGIKTLPPRWPHFFSDASWSSKWTPATPASM